MLLMIRTVSRKPPEMDGFLRSGGGQKTRVVLRRGATSFCLGGCCMQFLFSLVLSGHEYARASVSLCTGWLACSFGTKVRRAFSVSSHQPRKGMDCRKRRHNNKFLGNNRTQSRKRASYKRYEIQSSWIRNDEVLRLVAHCSIISRPNRRNIFLPNSLLTRRATLQWTMCAASWQRSSRELMGVSSGWRCLWTCQNIFPCFQIF